MNDYQKFVTTDLLPAFVVGQWVSVFEDVANIAIYIVVSVTTKVILNILERRSKNVNL